MISSLEKHKITGNEIIRVPLGSKFDYRLSILIFMEKSYYWACEVE